ncbi:AAA family ATPase [Streptomyces sp. NBC_01361]|uniref:AAA family ATPase n=1 Tax=Streptomyces sp. NBC_01361 TaxID=2903838 RepID=UPI002E31751F|nr:AAA family ATPase [Streptomyces sp. NBC_01361]
MAELFEMELEAFRTVLAAVESHGVDDPDTLALMEYNRRIHDPAPRSAWAPVNVADIIAGRVRVEPPEILMRADGAALLYPGKTHMFYGESESGKSWLALIAIAEQLAAGRSALFVDFESDAVTVVGRLMALGADPVALGERFAYVRPDAAPKPGTAEGDAFAELLGQRFAVAVVDGSTDAYMLYGLNPNEQTDIASFTRQLPNRLAESTGAAVVLIDHVVKSNDGRGRFPIGGQHKLSAVTGAAFYVEPGKGESIGAGKRGVMVMRVTKDRPAQVRARSGAYRDSDRTQESARVVLDSTGEISAFEVLAPDSLDTASGEAKPFVPTLLRSRIEEFLNAYPGASRTAITDGVKGMKSRVSDALADMVSEGLVDVRAKSGKGGGYAHFLADLKLGDAPGIFNHSEEGLTRSSN